jgi:hypothetical protein
MDYDRPPCATGRQAGRGSPGSAGAPNPALHPARGGSTVLAGDRSCGRRGQVNLSFSRRGASRAPWRWKCSGPSYSGKPLRAVSPPPQSGTRAGPNPGAAGDTKGLRRIQHRVNSSGGRLTPARAGDRIRPASDRPAPAEGAGQPARGPFAGWFAEAIPAVSLPTHRNSAGRSGLCPRRVSGMVRAVRTVCQTAVRSNNKFGRGKLMAGEGGAATSLGGRASS